MNKSNKIILSYFIVFIHVILSISSVSAAHYIVGEVYDALDSTSANDRIITIWNPSNGIADNLTDIIGTAGNSGVDNVYFADCELLSNPCQIGDTINAKVFDNGDGYSTKTVNLTITGAGYDVAPNLTIALQINFINISFDDSYQDIASEIDLIPASTSQVSCQGIIQGSEIDNVILNVTSKIFSNESSFYADTDENYKHYSNNSCIIDTNYGDLDSLYVNCSQNVQYYSIPGNWTCSINATTTGSTKMYSLNSKINTLLALELPDSINYGITAPLLVSDEIVAPVSNAGNVAINLSLTVYGQNIGDNISMYCPSGAINNISLDLQRYNLTDSNPGSIGLTEFQNKYESSQQNTIIKEFNLNPRQNDITNDAAKNTYWRIYLPEGLEGSCSGNIIFGAVNSPST